MAAPEINPDLLVDAPEEGSDFGTVTRGNHATHGDAFSGGNHHIDKSCVVRQNIYCAKALEGAAFQVNTSNYGDPQDPQFDPEHVYTTNIVAGFVKNDAAGNFLFGQANGGGGASALDQLTDVTLTFPAGREYLCFDSASSQWVNEVIALDDLGDVTVTTPTDGQHLVYDAGTSMWINKNSNELADLDDVTLTAEANGDFLRFNGSAWVNAALTPSDIPASALNDLSDVSAAAPNSGDHLEFDGVNWIAAAPGHTAPGAASLNDLSDVTITTPATNSVFQYNGTQWIDQADLVLDSAAGAYFGDTATDGSWRAIALAGAAGDFFIQQRKTGTYRASLHLTSIEGADNRINLINGTTGVLNPTITVAGGGASINLEFGTKGTGAFVFRPGGSNPAAGLLGVSSNGVLLFNQGVSAETIALNELSDVTLTSPVIRNVLVYDGANWRNESDMTLDSAAGYHVGSATANDTWRMGRAGTDLIFSRREATTYNEKFRFTSAGDLQFLASGQVPKLLDINGNAFLRFDTAASAVNFVAIQNSTAANGPRILATSDVSVNVDLNLAPRGTGAVVSESDIEVSSTDAYYLGDRNTNGTWRFVRNGTDLRVELREAGTYNSKGSFTP